MNDVLITGAGGLIGSWLLKTAPRFVPEKSIVGLTHPELDVTNFAAVRREFQRLKPGLVIHCAAMSKSPECEANPEPAHKINVEATAVLADLAREIPFVFLSSDLVFDGRAGNYTEDALVNPLSIYGRTKADAERVVLANPRHLVVRTSLNAGVSPAGDRGIEEQMRLAWKQGKALRLFRDEFRSPIPAEATARAVWELVNRGAKGLYHVSGAERLSRWQIGQLFAERWPEWKPRIVEASLAEYQGAARPPDTSLNCAKAQALLSFSLPRFSDWVWGKVGV